ncbi:Alpha/Beta hydrolase protein [Biscogniauxia mediterranea]|nr:Alpha/Beta hydrolase protein [Biscogniauxia mediterranea]
MLASFLFSAFLSFEARVLYQHRRTVDIRELNIPEQVEYSHRQVIPFNIATPDGLKLHAWHILPIGLLLQPHHRPAERLVLHCHGIDALSVFKWATDVAKIPSERIVIFGQSLGAGVAISIARELALRNIAVAGIIISGVIIDVPTISTTYCVAGLLPVAMPLAKFPVLMNYFVSRLTGKWDNKGRLVEYLRPVQRAEYSQRYTTSNQMELEIFDGEKITRKTELAQGGHEVFKFSLHDRVLSFPLNGIAVLRAFRSVDPNFAA